MCNNNSLFSISAILVVVVVIVDAERKVKSSQIEFIFNTPFPSKRVQFLVCGTSRKKTTLSLPWQILGAYSPSLKFDPIIREQCELSVYNEEQWLKWAHLDG